MNLSGWIQKDFSCSLSAAPKGTLWLEPVTTPSAETCWRKGRFHSSTGGELRLSIGHSPGSSRLLYLRQEPFPPYLSRLLDLPEGSVASHPVATLPGQLLLGPERTAAVQEGVRSLLRSPALAADLATALAEPPAVVPILREGLKYGVAESLFNLHGIVPHEIVVDCHHVPASEVPGYGRRAEVSLFKDTDLTEEERKAVKTVFIADSIAGGIVLVAVLERVMERFPNTRRIELVAPLVTMHALARLAAATHLPPLRVHCFETVLDALAPDFYDSAQFSAPEWHVDPTRATACRDWWGQNEAGEWIADTLCAGVGWSEAFFAPPEQVRMLEGRLRKRHRRTIASILSGNLSPAG
jgi:hypothetical protein